MSKGLLYSGVAAAMVAASAGSARAESIFVENPGFEANVLEDGAWTTFAPDGWTLLEGWFGTFNPTENHFPGGVPDGYNAAYGNGGTIAQVLSAVLEADTQYTLRVDIGNRRNFPFPGYRVELLAGGELVAEDDDNLRPQTTTFETAHVRFHTDATDPLVGLPLEIRLVSLGRQIAFDNVRVNSSPIPAPTAMALLAVAGLAGRRRRR
jgi:MYXO-CTERM domain-containing protein